MNYPALNQQQLLAEQAFMKEIQINYACYEAILKIKRWKFIIQIPGIASRIILEANASLKKNFFNMISNESIIEKEYLHTAMN